MQTSAAADFILHSAPWLLGTIVQPGSAVKRKICLLGFITDGKPQGRFIVSFVKKSVKKIPLIL